MKLTKYKYFFLPSLFAAFMGGCSTTPQHEVKGVCKSCKPYFVRGEWHYPQKHYDYDEFGLASWYGPGFHGKPKPHGEPYNQYEMTAAHKTLPIPTIAKVTNLETGQSVKVLIDDRGPFVYQGRIIDLSIAAAQKVGVYKKGTAKVRVTALREESDRFAQHLAQYRKAKCPKGRRWIEVYKQEVASHFGDFESNYKSQQAVYREPKQIYQPPKQIEPKLIQVNQIQKTELAPPTLQQNDATPLKQDKPLVVEVKQIQDDALDYISNDWKTSKPKHIEVVQKIVKTHKLAKKEKPKLIKTKLIKKSHKKHK